MIMEQYNNNLKVSGTMETQEFTIKADDGKLFHILSNLYSNPVGAVVRELSTNCLDAHKMAKNDEQFHIILSDGIEYDYFIKFRDFGVGMDHQTITQIFTKYGESTKTNSNESTGCLGLGSKSPFTISDSFTITNIFQGMKTIYGVTKNERNVPMLVVFDSYSTDERNGLEITVPLEKDFRDVIKYHIKHELLFFKNKPKVFEGEEEITIWHNQTINDVLDLYKSDSKINFSNNSEIKKLGKMSVVQGEVRYNLDIQTFFNTHIKIKNSMKLWEVDEDGKISDDTRNLTTKILNTVSEYHQAHGSSIVYLADMGEVSFAPSREELIFDSRTIKNIMGNFINFVKEYYKILLNFAHSIECPIELRNIAKYSNNVYDKYDKDLIPMLYRNSSIIPYVDDINTSYNKRYELLSKNKYIHLIYNFVNNRNYNLAKKNIYTPKIDDTKRYVYTKTMEKSIFNKFNLSNKMSRVILINLNDPTQSKRIKKFIKYMTVAYKDITQTFIVIEHTFKQDFTAQKYFQKMFGLTEFYFLDTQALPKKIKNVDLKTKQVIEKNDIFLDKQTIGKDGYRNSIINLADTDDKTVYVITNRDNVEFDQFDGFAKEILNHPNDKLSMSKLNDKVVDLFRVLNIDHELKLVIVSKSVFTRCKTTFKKNNVLHLNDVLLDIFKNNSKKSFKYIDTILEPTAYDRTSAFLLLTAYFYYISDSVKYADKIARFNKLVYSLNSKNSNWHNFKVDNFKNLFDSSIKKNIFDFAVNKFFDECLYYFENNNNSVKIETNVLSNNKIRDSLIEIGYTFTKTMSIPKFLYDNIVPEVRYSYEMNCSYFSHGGQFRQIKINYFEALYGVFLTNHKSDFYKKVGLKD